MILAVRLDPCQEVFDFVEATNERMRSKNIIRNPFTGRVRCISGCLFFAASSIYPEVIPRRFIAWVLKQGLKKAGYRGPCKYLSKNQSLEVLFNAVPK